MPRALNLYETYSRQDVHDLFVPGKRFIPRAGTWGMWGFVPIADKPGDFVFFVSIGKEQAGHKFDEWITEDGIINWQSQPRQSLADRRIQQFIHHNPVKNNIYLFLRRQKTGPYTYLGRLAYHDHDPKRECPVHFHWQILEWNPPPMVLQTMGLTLRSGEPQPAPQATSTVSFEWRGIQYTVDREALRSTIQQHIHAGLPYEATRFRDWYIELEGQRLSTKWIFHLLTGADYSEFDAPTARDKLYKIGIQSYPVQQSAETAKPLPDNVPPAAPPSPTETAALPTHPEEIESPTKTVQFEWRDTVYSYNEQALHNSLHKRIQEGLPEDALQIDKWYIAAAGQTISPKWVFHRLTKANFQQFNTQTAHNRISQLGLPVFYRANYLDIKRGCTVQLAYPNLAANDSQPNHHAFAQAFVQKINQELGNGLLVFPNSQNKNEVNYILTDIGQGFLRRNKQGELELSFEFSNTGISPDTLLQKVKLVLPEAQKSLGYPIYVAGLAKNNWRVSTEIIIIDKFFFEMWDFLYDSLHDSNTNKLDGKNVPEQWDQYYKKVKQSHPRSPWDDLADTLFGMALAEFINAIAPVIQQASQQNESDKDKDRPQLPEGKMSEIKFFRPQTIKAMIDLIFELAQVGEVSLESTINNGLRGYHLFQLVRSGWAIPTPYSLVVTPRFVNILPINDRDAIKDLLNLSNWDIQGWANFDRKAFHLPIPKKYPNLGFEYIYGSKPSIFYQDNLWRPVWLVNYLPENDWDDWEVSNLMQAYPSLREAKLYVHSALPIQNIYGGTPEAQDASWKTAFYWLMLQLLILSDPETGSYYDPRIFLTLSDGWREGSLARLYLQGEYIGDLADCLQNLLLPFRWVWVNRSGSATQDQQSVLGLLRLLLKINIAELGKDGRVQFTDAYRRHLFESQAKAQLYYLSSKEARDQLRDAIKEMSQ